PSTLPRFDPTEGMSMPRSAMQAMIEAVPDALMRDLRADAFKPNPMAVSGGLTKPAPSEPPKTIGTKGWVEARPLTAPEGIGLVDQIAEGFAKRERRGG